MIQVDDCPACHKSSFAHFADSNHAEIALQYWICRSCGLVFQSPRQSEEELRGFYQKGYRTLYQDSELPTKKDAVIQKTRAALTVKMIRQQIPSIARHLDIGSSSGALLQAVRAAYRNEMVGVEPGEGYRRFSEADGVKAFGSIDELLNAKVGSFDFVSMMHVLEHLVDPLHVLKTMAKEILTPAGYVLIEVPNLYEHASFALAHLYAFTPETLANLVRRAGFQVLWSKAHGSFRSPILKLYITLLAQLPDPPVTQRIIPVRARSIRFRRTIGEYKRRVLTRFLPDWTWQAPEILWEDDGA